MKEKTGYCGIYCGACPSFLKSTCFGCRSEDKSQNRNSKWSCKIRNCCIDEKKIEYCGKCNEFPCKEIKRKLIYSHKGDPKFNYRQKIPENMTEINELGLENWSQQQEQLWSCSNCGQTIMFYYYKCNSCGKEADPQIT
jgi:hypothetical protein